MPSEASKPRSLTAAIVAGSLVLAGSAVVFGQDAEPDLSGQSLVISNWEGYMPEDLPERFEEATGVPVTVANHATNATAAGTFFRITIPSLMPGIVAGGLLAFTLSLDEFVITRSSPASVTDPASGHSKPARMRSKVVLPQPEDVLDHPGVDLGVKDVVDEGVRLAVGPWIR